MKRQFLLWRILVGVALAVGMSVTLALPVPTPAAAAGARPLFQLPFKCGEQWYASTYSGHSPNASSLDFTRIGGGTNGAPILASAPGRVTYAGWDNGGGWMVNLAHANGWGTTYLHMIERPAVGSGATVAMGQQIGRVGSTGDSSGPHLHYQQWMDGPGNTVRSHFNGVPVNVWIGQSQTLTSRNCGQAPGPGGLSTWGSGVRIRKDATTKSDVVATLAGPTPIEVECQKVGEKITAEGHTNDAWAYLPKYPGFVSNIFVDVPEAWLPGIRECATFPTWGTGVNIRKEATTQSAVVATLAGPTNVKVQCQKRGEKVTVDGITNDAWSLLPEKGGYVSNIFVDHKAAWLPLIPECSG